MPNNYIYTCLHLQLHLTGALHVVFIAYNINHSSILSLMALNSLYCADVTLSNYSLTGALHIL